MTTFAVDFDTKKLERNIRAIKPKLQRRVLRQGLRKAAQPILAQARRLAPRDRGDYARSLGISATVKGTRGEASVGARRGSQFGQAARISHLLEFGTSRTPAKPHLRPAFDSQKRSAAETLGSAMMLEVEKVLRV